MIEPKKNVCDTNKDKKILIRNSQFCWPCQYSEKCELCFFVFVFGGGGNKSNSELTFVYYILVSLFVCLFVYHRQTTQNKNMKKWDSGLYTSNMIQVDSLFYLKLSFICLLQKKTEICLFNHVFFLFLWFVDHSFHSNHIEFIFFFHWYPESKIENKIL